LVGLADKSEVVDFGVAVTELWEATFSIGSGILFGIILIFIPRLRDFLSAAEIFPTSSSRTESFNIAPQLGQIDKAMALLRLQTGQFIEIEKIKELRKEVL